jgi:AraC-like DNA-binding protein
MADHRVSPARSFAEALPMPSGYFSLILRSNASSERVESALLSGTGLCRDSLPAGGDITLGQQLVQIRNAEHALEPGWSLETGTRFTAVTHGPLTAAAVCAPSLRLGLQAMMQFGHLRAPHTQLSGVRGDREVYLVLDDRVPLSGAESRVLLELVMLSNQALIESQLGRPMVEGRFEFPYPAPEYARRYRELFHAPVRFGCPRAAIVIPLEWLAVECPFADAVAYRAALDRLALGARHFDAGRRLVARVEQILASKGARPKLDTVARLLGLSARTLTRRLSEQGTSFQSLMDETLKSQAAALLLHEDLSLTEIARALGYDDAANFGRAFRRWFEMSPGHYRSELIDRIGAGC